MGRGKEWTADEDMFLARSVVQVSHDPIVEADQKSSKFYSRVLQQFLKFFLGGSWTADALSNRWKEIQASVSNLVHIMRHRRPSQSWASKKIIILTKRFEFTMKSKNFL